MWCEIGNTGRFLSIPNNDLRNGGQAIFNSSEYLRGVLVNAAVQPSWFGNIMGYSADSPETHRLKHDKHWLRAVPDDIQ